MGVRGPQAHARRQLRAPEIRSIRYYWVPIDAQMHPNVPQKVLAAVLDPVALQRVIAEIDSELEALRRTLRRYGSLLEVSAAVT